MGIAWKELDRMGADFIAVGFWLWFFWTLANFILIFVVMAVRKKVFD
jgi:hypothetical protein